MINWRIYHEIRNNVSTNSSKSRTLNSVVWMMFTCAVFLCRPLEREVKMDKTQRFDFSLESDDRTEDEKLLQKAGNKSGLASSLGLGQDPPKAPMDTDYQEEMEKTKPQIRFNLNFDKWASPCEDRLLSAFCNTHYTMAAVCSQALQCWLMRLLDLLTHIIFL